MERPELLFRRLRAEDADIELPRYMTQDASGMDIRAAVTAPVLLKPGMIRKIPTGFSVAIPKGYEIQVRPRSGLATRHGVTLINAPGTIDADYRGEIMAALINHGPEPYTVRRGDRIAQMILSRVWRGKIREVEELPPSGRGTGGFGHTGYR